MSIDFPADENGEILRSMQANGDDLTIARDIDFSLLFADEASAEAFSGIMEEEGYAADYDPWEVQSADDANAGKWDVLITRHMVPEHAAITAFEQELQALAMPFGGKADGWGCFEATADDEEA